MYYECHITLGLHPKSARVLIEALNNWKYSSIEGDPDLGSGPREYATRRASSNVALADVVAHMDKIALILNDEGYNVLRSKVELVMYDKRWKE